MTLETLNKTHDQQVIIRPVTFDDLQAATLLIQAEEIEHHGKANETPENLRREWEAPGFDLASSTRGVFTPDGKMIAYCEILDNRPLPVRPYTWGYVHPDHRGQGIGTDLVQWVKKRALQTLARVPEDVRVVLEGGAFSTDPDARQLLEDNGFVYAERSWLNMVIDLEAPPSAPSLPPGITITTLADYQGELADVYRASRAAFRDHRGSVDEPFEQAFTRWQYHHIEDEKHDPTLWFLAMDGDIIAGVSLCRPESWVNPHEGYVKILGVNPDYRKQGLGLALLLYTFGEFWQRGTYRVSLHVDGSSLTGATRLYEKAGMRVYKTHDAFELELRPGRELSRQ